MAKTRTQLIHQTLYNLGVLPIGQNPGTEEYNQVNLLVDAMLEDLIARDVCYIEDVDAIEEKYFLHLAHVLAGQSQSLFGMQNDPALTARGIKGEQDLKRVASTRPTYGALEICPY